MKGVGLGEVRDGLGRRPFPLRSTRIGLPSRQFGPESAPSARLPRGVAQFIESIRRVKEDDDDDEKVVGVVEVPLHRLDLRFIP